MAEPKYAAIPAQAPPADPFPSLTGLEALQGMLAGKYPGPPIAKLMNFQLHEVGKGQASFRGQPGSDVLNPMGTVHGGWYGAILDSALGCAVMSTLERGVTYTTLEYKINIIRPVPTGLQVEARAQVSHAGRSTGVASAVLTGVADGRIYATGSTTCLVLQQMQTGAAAEGLPQAAVASEDEV
jgi:uncharacterized protein (TIGR00369 family)